MLCFSDSTLNRNIIFKKSKEYEALCNFLGNGLKQFYLKQ